MRLQHPWLLVLYVLWFLGSPVIIERLSSPESNVVGPEEPGRFLVVGIVSGVLTVAPGRRRDVDRLGPPSTEWRLDRMIDRIPTT